MLEIHPKHRDRKYRMRNGEIAVYIRPLKSSDPTCQQLFIHQRTTDEVTLRTCDDGRYLGPCDEHAWDIIEGPLPETTPVETPELWLTWYGTDKPDAGGVYRSLEKAISVAALNCLHILRIPAGTYEGYPAKGGAK